MRTQEKPQAYNKLSLAACSLRRPDYFLEFLLTYNEAQQSVKQQLPSIVESRYLADNSFLLSFRERIAIREMKAKQPEIQEISVKKLRSLTNRYSHYRPQQEDATEAAVIFDQTGQGYFIHIDCPLGLGGFGGDVFLGQNIDTGQWVVIKIQHVEAYSSDFSSLPLTKEFKERIGPKQERELFRSNMIKNEIDQLKNRNRLFGVSSITRPFEAENMLAKQELSRVANRSLWETLLVTCVSLVATYKAASNPTWITIGVDLLAILTLGLTARKTYRSYCGFDFRRKKETHYIIQKLIDGSDLASLDKKKVSYEEGLQLALNILKKLKTFHDQGDIILDLNPGNIIYNKKNGEVEFVDLAAICNLEGKLELRASSAGSFPRDLESERRDVYSKKSDIYLMSEILRDLLTKSPELPITIEPTLLV